MEYLTVKIMKKWNAIYAKTKKRVIKDTITREKLGNWNRLPCLFCKPYDNSNMASLQDMEREGNRVLDNPRFKFGDMMLELNRFDFRLEVDHPVGWGRWWPTTTRFLPPSPPPRRHRANSAHLPPPNFQKYHLSSQFY
jgi:hypothetical protein